MENSLYISNVIDELKLKKNTALKSNIIDKNQENIDISNRYCYFIKLIRIIAWCLRFLNNCKVESGIRKHDYLDTFEQKANKNLIKTMQNSAIPTDVRFLNKIVLPHKKVRY